MVFGFESLKKYNLHIYNVEVDEKFSRKFHENFVHEFFVIFEIWNLLERISH